MKNEANQTNPKFIIDSNSLKINIKDNVRPYQITWNRLITERQLIEWISHLSKKNWISKDQLNEFILIVNRENKFNLLVE